MAKRRVGRPRKRKVKRRLSVKIRDGRKRIQIGGKKYTLTPVGKGKKKRVVKKKVRRRLPPRVKSGKNKGRFKKRK